MVYIYSTRTICSWHCFTMSQSTFYNKFWLWCTITNFACFPKKIVYVLNTEWHTLTFYAILMIITIFILWWCVVSISLGKKNICWTCQTKLSIYSYKHCFRTFSSLLYIIVKKQSKHKPWFQSLKFKMKQLANKQKSWQSVLLIQWCMQITRYFWCTFSFSNLYGTICTLYFWYVFGPLILTQIQIQKINKKWKQWKWSILIYSIPEKYYGFSTMVLIFKCILPFSLSTILVPCFYWHFFDDEGMKSSFLRITTLTSLLDFFSQDIRLLLNGESYNAISRYV